MKPNTLILATLLATSGLLQADDTATIKAPLQAVTGSATGVVTAKLQTKRSELTVTLAKLAPAKIYDIEVAGIVEGSAVTDTKGRATVKFSTAPKGLAFPLDFDPRGEKVRILDAGASVLEGTVSGGGELSGSVVSEQAELERESGPSKSRAKVSFSRKAKGRQSFRVDVLNVTPGKVEVFHEGVKRGEIEVRGRSANLTFDSAPTGKSVELEFEPREGKVDLISGGTVIFTGKMEAKARGVNEAKPSVSKVQIASTGADADATAEASLRIDQRARKHFSVELEDLPVGSYDLLADDVVVGSIAVSTVTGGTKGEVEFTSGDDDGTELPLTFDPLGKTLSIKQGTTKYFEGLFDPNVTGTGTPGTEPPSTLDELMASTGLDPDAKAEAKYEVDARGRHKFSVEIEDVPAGSYTLSVAGATRGTIVASLINGKVNGEIEFETDDNPAKTDLTFDPRGQTIEISSAAGLYFSHLLGSGSASPVGNSVTPFDTTIALFSTGKDSDASASAEYQRKETGELSFEVEAEDLAAGAYDVLVDGTVRGTLTVAATSKGTRGKLKFEDAGLNFDVIGKEIAIDQSGVRYFARTFPNP